MHANCADLSEPQEGDFHELAAVLAERSKQLRDAARQIRRCDQMARVTSLMEELNTLSPMAPVDAATPTKEDAQQMLAEAHAAYQRIYESLLADRLAKVRSSWRN
ncbi:MAG: hypothetical protein KJ938_12615 [Actinobacteria bacterium]|nr:hypothetical protein [Actinomycetota bacterium]